MIKCFRPKFIRPAGHLKQLLLLLGLAVFTSEALHTSGGVDELLFASKIRMTIGADFYADCLSC